MDNLEFQRKALHIAAGFSIVASIYFEVLTPLLLLIIIILGTLLCYSSKKFNIEQILWLAQQFERPLQYKILPGLSVILFLVGSLITISIFPKDLAIAGILVLTLGDGLSPMFGKKYGKINHPFTNKKHIEGSIIGGLAAFFGIMLFTIWGYINITPIEALAACLIAMLVEGIELEFHRDLGDDNLIIPVVASGVIWLTRLI